MKMALCQLINLSQKVRNILKIPLTRASYNVRSCIPLIWQYRESSDTERRTNEINIQMLSKSLHEQIFHDVIATESKSGFEKIKSHLNRHSLWEKECTIMDDISLILPRFYGKNISEHFENIARKESSEYFELAQMIANFAPPQMPKEWKFQSGWTKYTSDGKSEKVEIPDESVLVFDVEVCLQENMLPVMATALSKQAWYCWLSDVLVDENSSFRYSSRLSPNCLIPLEKCLNGSRCPSKKLVIGHNVGYDRSYVKEQYYMEKSAVMFLDTLSLHMCTSGLTGIQRILMNSKESKKSAWMDVGSLNNLGDVYELYTSKEKLDKSMRDLFVEGTIDDIRENFQSCVEYCANDVKATHEVFTELWPEFLEHAPHPVTFAGMLEMGTSYLPIDDSWQRYIEDTKETYDDLEDEIKNTLMKLAEDSCRSLHNERYQKDPWLWSLDWSVQDLTLKKEKKVSKKRRKRTQIEEDRDEELHEIEDLNNLPAEELMEREITTWYPDLPDADSVMFKRRPHLPGYPSWYRKLCQKQSDTDWAPGPTLISPQTRYAPLLLRMTWDGFPLFYSAKYGWGYLVPGRENNLGTTVYDPPPDKKAKKKKGAVLVGLGETNVNEDDEESSLGPDRVFPTESFQEMLRRKLAPVHITSYSDEEIMNLDENDILLHENRDSNLKKPSKLTAKGSHFVAMKEDGIGPFNDVNLPGVWFYKIPHKNGEHYRCGNPLGKDYLNKMEDGTLASDGGYNATRTLQSNKMISFWRNAQKRVCSQMTVYLDKDQLTNELKNNKDYDIEQHYGAIIPRVITAGTVTRRAVEITWLTASNPRADRVGSELKAMVRAPPGHCFVGADVDSQELWIAAILGDAKFAGVHGCTAFGWMTLQGKKSDGTDLHSKTADTINISRDDAKILNYGRIYGAGQRYAKQLLMQFNHRLTEESAEEKAAQLYKTTKGIIRYQLTDFGKDLADRHQIMVNSDDFIDSQTFREILRKGRISRKNEKTVAVRRWTGGSESEMFNKLEDIAVSDEPRTPVLNCKISRALDPNVVKNEFITSRLNWVVQSSAVDYLHLMLVCMKWLFNEYKIQGRFCISIHDEVRYIVAEKDKYRAAMALQITNLLTRAMFAYKLGMYDLPLSVAFFSTVDIDKVIRKEVTMDCKTPSNPHGLKIGHGIPAGEALDIYQILSKTNGGSLEKETNSIREQPLQYQSSC